VGLAAGFDKNAEVADAMLGFGFGFVEVGTITPKRQAGNPRPRMFRLRRDRAVINRLGFNNQGVEAAATRLARRDRGGGVVAVNIGPNRDAPDPIADYETCIVKAAALADLLVLNVSSPNTPGLRELQGRGHIEEVLGRAMGARDSTGSTPPILLKIAPDLDLGEIEAVVEAAAAGGAGGLVVGNTTVSRPAGLAGRRRGEPGGLSGRPLFALSTKALAEAFRLARGRLVLVGVGGVSSGADAYAKVRAGANLVELYTALAYEGPGLVARIHRELAALLARDGFAHVAEAVGTGFTA
jgi:dihydroorotate dehydrogenase